MMPMPSTGLLSGRRTRAATPVPAPFLPSGPRPKQIAMTPPPDMRLMSGGLGAPSFGGPSTDFGFMPRGMALGGPSMENGFMPRSMPTMGAAPGAAMTIQDLIASGALRGLF